jgi:hypothetical protein
MELATKNKHRTTLACTNNVSLTWTAAYAMDRGVTLSFRFTFDATFRRAGFLPDDVLCDFAAGDTFSALSSSSEISLAEEGEVNMAL